MPGSYAHITLVNEASEKRRLKGIAGFPREAVDAAGLHLNFLELGCISPDYPYLMLPWRLKAMGRRYALYPYVPSDFCGS